MNISLPFYFVKILKIKIIPNKIICDIIINISLML